MPRRSIAKRTEKRTSSHFKARNPIWLEHSHLLLACVSNIFNCIGLNFERLDLKSLKYFELEPVTPKLLQICRKVAVYSLKVASFSKSGQKLLILPSIAHYIGMNAA